LCWKTRKEIILSGSGVALGDYRNPLVLTTQKNEPVPHTPQSWHVFSATFLISSFGHDPPFTFLLRPGMAEAHFVGVKKNTQGFDDTHTLVRKSASREPLFDALPRSCPFWGNNFEKRSR